MQARTITFPKYRHMFLTSVTISVLSLIVYVYAINQTVRNIVMRQKIQSELSVLTSNIGEMEFKYISLQNSIGLNKAYAMGFKDISSNTFVSREPSVAFAGSRNITR